MANQRNKLGSNREENTAIILYIYICMYINNSTEREREQGLGIHITQCCTTFCLSCFHLFFFMFACSGREGEESMLHFAILSLRALPHLTPSLPPLAPVLSIHHLDRGGGGAGTLWSTNRRRRRREGTCISKEYSYSLRRSAKKHNQIRDKRGMKYYNSERGTKMKRRRKVWSLILKLCFLNKRSYLLCQLMSQ